MALYMTQPSLRGYCLNVNLPGDHGHILTELEKAGLSPNAFAEEVVANALRIRDEEEKRMASSLALKGEPREIAICRSYRNLQKTSTWLFLRHSADNWFLSAILFE